MPWAALIVGALYVSGILFGHRLARRRSRLRHEAREAEREAKFRRDLLRRAGWYAKRVNYRPLPHPDERPGSEE